MTTTTINKKGNNRGRLFVLWLCGMMTISVIFLSMQQAIFQERFDAAQFDLPPKTSSPILRSSSIISSVSHDDDDLRSKEDTLSESQENSDKPLTDIQQRTSEIEKAEEVSEQQTGSSSDHNDEDGEDDNNNSGDDKDKSSVDKVKTKQENTKAVTIPSNKQDGEISTNKKKKKARPPLESLIKDADRGVTGHVSFLLDWAIIGHAKAATSFIMKWLSKHPEVKTWDKEVCDLYDNKPAGLVKRLYTELPEGKYKRGFKCPGHFSRRSIRYFKKYFSKTRVIVGVRHPVRWFES